MRIILGETAKKEDMIVPNIFTIHIRTLYEDAVFFFHLLLYLPLLLLNLESTTIHLLGLLPAPSKPTEEGERSMLYCCEVTLYCNVPEIDSPFGFGRKIGRANLGGGESEGGKFEDPLYEYEKEGNSKTRFMNL